MWTIAISELCWPLLGLACGGVGGWIELCSTAWGFELGFSLSRHRAGQEPVILRVSQCVPGLCVSRQPP